jgi:hypothetical protein
MIARQQTVCLSAQVQARRARATRGVGEPCIYISIYIYIHVCIYIFIYIHIYRYIYICLHTQQTVCLSVQIQASGARAVRGGCEPPGEQGLHPRQIPSEERATQIILRTFTWKNRPKYGLDCLICAMIGTVTNAGEIRQFA